MKKTAHFLWLSLIFVCSAAIAQVMLVQPMSVILQKLKNEGYSVVQKAQLNANANEYVISALDDEGEPTQIRINSHSAEIIEIKKTDSHIDMLEIVEKIEGVGYSGISRIESKGGIYEVDALGRNGKEVHLNINATSGEISKI